MTIGATTNKAEQFLGENLGDLNIGQAADLEASQRADSNSADANSNPTRRTLWNRVTNYLRQNAWIDNLPRLQSPTGNPSTLSTTVPNPGLSQRAKDCIGATLLVVGSVLFCMATLVFGGGNGPSASVAGNGAIVNTVEQSVDQWGRSLDPQTQNTNRQHGRGANP